MYGMYNCELDYMHNFDHDCNIGNFLSTKALKYFDNSAKFLYKEGVEAFSVGIATVEMEKYFVCIVIICVQ